MKTFGRFNLKPVYPPRIARLPVTVARPVGVWRIVAVERNLERILEIAQDYLAWHVQKLEDSLAPPPEPQPPIVFIDPEDEEEGGKKKKKGFFKRMVEAAQEKAGAKPIK